MRVALLKDPQARARIVQPLPDTGSTPSPGPDPATRPEGAEPEPPSGGTPTA
jgi:hypothetical protein